MLRVTVEGARCLYDVDRFGGKSDPYVGISFQGKNNVTLFVIITRLRYFGDIPIR